MASKHDIPILDHPTQGLFAKAAGLLDGATSAAVGADVVTKSAPAQDGAGNSGVLAMAMGAVAGLVSAVGGGQNISMEHSAQLGRVNIGDQQSQSQSFAMHA